MTTDLLDQAKPVRDNVIAAIKRTLEDDAPAEIRDGHIMIDALRDIQKGEELTIDYDLEYYDEFIRPVGCKCSAKKHH